MLTVHHLGVSQSERIVWLCEELEIPYTLKRYERDPQTRRAPAEYKALHPQGTAPVISDGELVLPESAAIIEYIGRKYGGGRMSVAPDAPNYADYLYWFHYANGSFMPVLMLQMLGLGLSAAPDHPRMGFVMQRLAQARILIEERLARSDYFAGPQLTGADVMMMFPLSTMRNFSPLDLSQMPATRAYLQRIAARPAYQRAMAKGDPGMPLKLL
ncbi:glutathione S-transferase [Solimonas aquatica]|uniref:glutathione transferase n=1 Tax=Solimonas aquatica TaxID=489703 RepID=A0A1H9ITB2_9GAMM|nr:glutathione S-transferase [Solimonas aquatica]SEQ77655.1 glutathione S-transferase [Solimonas aquatica]